MADVCDIRLVEHECAVFALRLLALLLQKVAAAVALHGQFAPTRLSDPLLCAAVGLHLWHSGPRV